MALETMIWVAIVLMIVNAVLSLLLLVMWGVAAMLQHKRQGLQRQQSDMVAHNWEQLIRLWTSMEQLQRRQVGMVSRIADKVAPDD